MESIFDLYEYLITHNLPLVLLGMLLFGLIGVLNDLSKNRKK